MKHPLNGKRASVWDQKHALCVIAQIPFNPPYPPLDSESQPVRAMVQVVLRPDKITELGYLRLGETPGDEAHCWIATHQIHIVEVLGRATRAGANQPWEVSDALERDDVRAAA